MKKFHFFIAALLILTACDILLKENTSKPLNNNYDKDFRKMRDKMAEKDDYIDYLEEENRALNRQIYIMDSICNQYYKDLD